MFGSSPTSAKDDDTSVDASDSQKGLTSQISTSNNGAEKRTGSGGSPTEPKPQEEPTAGGDKKRRSSGVAKARDMFSSAKQSLHLHGGSASPSNTGAATQTPMQKLSRNDPALGVPQGSLNNSAGESLPGPKSTFRVGVTEDKNKKCRRTMEDTHSYLYNFLSTPLPNLGDTASKDSASDSKSSVEEPVRETDNGYFAIFDGHAGTFAADWCGKKLHVILEDMIRKNPNTPIPELLDQTFTAVDQQLEKLPLKNSGCTAVIAVLRWEDRVPSTHHATGSAPFASVAAASAKAVSEAVEKDKASSDAPTSSQANSDTTNAAVPLSDAQPVSAEDRLKLIKERRRILYTANVGDARIVLCRNGRALRLSYDHKGSDEREGRRVAEAGGLILNNRVNGVLAVTRALGDAYMKDLVTGHPYTTETVINEDQDEFLILACDGLWDVCSDQEAVDLVRNTADPQAASKQLVDHALARFSTDNLSCMIVRFDGEAAKLRRKESIGVDTEQTNSKGPSEADALVHQAKKSLEESGPPATSDMILEEEEQEQDDGNGPELNEQAVKAAQKNPPAE